MSDWQLTVGSARIYNPTSTQYTTTEATHGSNVLEIGGGTTIKQLTNIDLAPNRQYTLNVDVGNRADVANANMFFIIELYAGSQFIGAIHQNNLATVNGGFVTGTATYTSPASVAAQQKLEIRISAAATLVNFDNVRLSSTVVDEQYAYDSNGNRLSTTGARQSALGSHNRLQTDGTYNYVYDNEGNIIRRTQISDGSVLEYQWDHRNRLTKISTKAAGATASSRDIFYYYDAFDRRVGKTIDYEGNGTIDRSWVYVFDGQNTVMVLHDADGAGSMQGYRISERILQGPAVDMVMSEEIYSGATGPLVGSSIASSNSGTTLWTIGDDQGSIQDAVDNNGVVRRRVNYSAFGQRTNQTDTDANGQVLPTNSTTALDTLFGYTGRDWDSDAQLQNNRARWYDPTTARWLSQDPIGFGGGDANLYRYVGNHPTYATDPSGLQEPIPSYPLPSGAPDPRPKFPFDPSMLPQPGIPEGYRPWRGPRGEQSCIGRLVKEAPDPGFQYLHIGFTYSNPDRDWAPWYGRAYTDTFANKTININVNNPDWNKAITELQKLGKFNVAVVVGHGAPNQAGAIYDHDIDNARTDSQNGSYRFLEELGKHLQGNKEVWLRTCNSGEDRFFLIHIARIVNGAVYGNTGTWAGIAWGDGRKAEAEPGYAPGSSSLDDDTWWPWPFE